MTLFPLLTLTLLLFSCDVVSVFPLLFTYDVPVVIPAAPNEVDDDDDDDDDDEEEEEDNDDKAVTHMNVDEFHEKQRERINNLVIEDHK